MESPIFEYSLKSPKSQKKSSSRIFRKVPFVVKKFKSWISFFWEEFSSNICQTSLYFHRRWGKSLFFFIATEQPWSTSTKQKKNQDEVHSKLGCIDTPVGQLSVAHTRDCITNWEWKEQVNDWMACCGVCDDCLDCKSQKPRPLVGFSKLEKYSSSSPLISVSQKIQG